MSVDNEILIEAKGVSKRFSKSLRKGMLYGLRDVGAAMLGVRRDQQELRKDEFWAVRDINFVLRRGECLGLIGHNGAGKSTLLKMLNGLILPDQGTITVRGKVGALIELGAGFNPLLSGRENIYVNGQLLGFSKAEIDQKMKAITDFAEIDAFLDAPMQNYSSGMKVRLGFAIAAQMEPDVLIIDEVLAVGDLGFVLKCFNAIDRMLKNTAVIFVSHSMPQVSRICSQVMVLDKGRSVYCNSDIAQGIDHYYSRFASGNKKNIVFDRDGDAELLEVRVGNTLYTEGAPFVSFPRLADVQLEFLLKVKQSYTSPYLTITVFDKEQRPVGVCQDVDGLNENNIVRREGEVIFYRSRLTMPRINLAKGIFSVSLSVNEEFRSRPMLRVQSVCVFQISSPHDIWQPVEFEGLWS